VRQTPYKPYLSLSGEHAAPVVAGTVALMLEENQSHTERCQGDPPDSAEQRARVLLAGAGVLNALGAVRMARFFESPLDGPPQPSDVIENERIT
jgi:hypothetical protein